MAEGDKGELLVVLIRKATEKSMMLKDAARFMKADIEYLLNELERNGSYENGMYRIERRMVSDFIVDKDKS